MNRVDYMINEVRFSKFERLHLTRRDYGEKMAMTKTIRTLIFIGINSVRNLFLSIKLTADC